MFIESNCNNIELLYSAASTLLYHHAILNLAASLKVFFENIILCECERPQAALIYQYLPNNSNHFFWLYISTCLLTLEQTKATDKQFGTHIPIVKVERYTSLARLNTLPVTLCKAGIQISCTQYQLISVHKTIYNKFGISTAIGTIRHIKSEVFKVLFYISIRYLAVLELI